MSRDRTDLLGDPRLPTGRPRSQLISNDFDTSKFRLNALGMFVRAGRNILIGQGSATSIYFSTKAIASAAASFGRILGAGTGSNMQLG